MTGVITPPSPTLAEAIPVIAVLAVFVGMFLSVRQRAGSERVRLWAYAWALTFLHFMTRIVQAHAGSLTRFVIAVDFATLELSAIVFLASFLFPVEDRKKRNFLMALLGAPIVAHAFAMYCLDEALWLRAGAFGFLFFGAAAFWFLASPRRTFAQLAGMGALCGIGAWGVGRLLHGDRNSSIGIILTLAFGLCGPLFWRLYRRRSPGVIIVTAGFCAWAAQFPVTVLLYMHGPKYLALLNFWNVPRLLVALGMVLTVIEDNLGVITQGQARVQAENRLIDRLSQIKSRLLAGDDAIGLFGEVASAITEASNFSSAAFLLIGEDVRLHLASSVGFTAEYIEGLRQQAGNDVIASFRSLAEHTPKAGNSSFLLCAEKNLVLIPLISWRGSAVGCLCVAGAKDPAGADFAQIVRLEVFASDLAVTIENMRLRQQLLRSEKLAAIGQLVAGVAHELNNPLTGILGYADLLGEEIQDPKSAQRVEKLNREAHRMRRILDGLLRFGRQNGSAMRSARIEVTLRDVLLFREYHLRSHGIQMDVQIEPLLPPVGMGEDELKQVLLNVLNNAIDAVQESAQRAIRVRGFQKSGRIMFQLEDSGPGFADLSRAFDPFYTTKPVGKGTGLGLSVCYGIVREAGGEITIENLQPYGARVAIDLPLAVSSPVVVPQPA